MTLVLFVGLWLCAYRLTRLFTKDLLLDKQRAWWFKRYPPNSDYAAMYAKNVSKWGQLVKCPWCIGFWVSGLTVLSALQFITMEIPVLWWFAISSAVGLTSKNLD